MSTWRCCINQIHACMRLFCDGGAHLTFGVSCFYILINPQDGLQSIRSMLACDFSVTGTLAWHVVYHVSRFLSIRKMGFKALRLLTSSCSIFLLDFLTCVSLILTEYCLDLDVLFYCDGHVMQLDLLFSWDSHMYINHNCWAFVFFLIILPSCILVFYLNHMSHT